MTTTIQELAQDLTRIKPELPKMMRQALTLTALDAEAQAKRNATDRLRVRTGRLRSSIQSRVEDVGSGVRVTVQAGDAEVPYARIQEEGGTITPRNARFLAIPVGPALTAAGVSRFRSPRDVQGLHYQHGTLRDQQGRVWYLLRRSVTIRGTRFLSAAVDTALQALPERVSVRFQTLVLGGA